MVRREEKQKDPILVTVGQLLEKRWNKKESKRNVSYYSFVLIQIFDISNVSLYV